MIAKRLVRWLPRAGLCVVALVAAHWIAGASERRFSSTGEQGSFTPYASSTIHAPGAWHAEELPASRSTTRHFGSDQSSHESYIILNDTRRYGAYLPTTSPNYGYEQLLNRSSYGYPWYGYFPWFGFRFPFYGFNYPWSGGGYGGSYGPWYGAGYGGVMPVAYGHGLYRPWYQNYYSYYPYHPYASPAYSWTPYYSFYRPNLWGYSGPGPYPSWGGYGMGGMGGGPSSYYYGPSGAYGGCYYW